MAILLECDHADGQVDVHARCRHPSIARRFVAADASPCADLFNLGGRRRGSLLDCMIAAVAVCADAALATTNPGDFRRFQTAGLRVVAA